MNVNIKRQQRRSIAAAMAGAILCTGGMASSPVQANSIECSPLHVIRIKPFRSQPIIENGRFTGVEFGIRVTVVNTNPTREYTPPKMRGHTYFYPIVRDSEGKRIGSGSRMTVFNSPIPGGKTKVVSGAIAGSNSGNAAVKFDKKGGLIASITANMSNYQCKELGADNRKRWQTAEFTYDFAPVLRGHQPRLIRGSTKGKGESRGRHPGGKRPANRRSAS